jgi:hypothetical protein
MVLDRGDRCLFIFLWARRLFCNIFPFPVCKAQLIGDWYEIGGAHRTQSSSLYSANTIGTPMHPAPIGVADRKRKKNYWLTVSGQHCLLAERDICAPIYWWADVPRAITIG